MRRFNLALSGMVLLLAAISCTRQDLVADSTQILRSVNVTAEDFILDNPFTRTAYTVDASRGFVFNWTAGDKLGIYPVGGDQVAFPISSGEGSKSATFDGGAWALRSTYSYACYYPFSSANYHNSETALPVIYTGQKQTGNDNTSHLGPFDYMAAGAAKPDADGVISITMRHLGCFAMFELTMPLADTFTQMTLTSDGTPFVTDGTFDLSAATPAIKPTKTSASITLSLNGVSTTAAKQKITLYAMLAPVSQSGSNIAVTINGTSGNTYKTNLAGKNMVARSAYKYTATITGGTNVSGEDANWGDDPTPDTNGHEYVDLGLSVLWATCNVGASKPEGYGDYFAWGETEPYYNGDSQNPTGWKSGKSGGYLWPSYKYCKGSETTMTKYCNRITYGYNGFTDSKTVLDPEDDAAHVNWGGDWRMPTRAEFDELLNNDNCTWTWTKVNGVNGYKVVSKKSGYTGNYIFLPAAGERYDTDLIFVVSTGVYWSSSLYAGIPDHALSLYFASGDYSPCAYIRNYGISVRPVCD